MTPEQTLEVTKDMKRLANELERIVLMLRTLTSYVVVKEMEGRSNA